MGNELEKKRSIFFFRGGGYKRKSFPDPYDAPQAFTKQTHPLMHHIVEKGVLYPRGGH